MATEQSVRGSSIGVIRRAVNVVVLAAAAQLLAGSADPKLQACLTAAVAGKPHTEVRILDCSFEGITSLAGLEEYRDLTTLYLSGNSITDLTPLASLPELVTLAVDRNPRVTSLAALTRLHALRELMLDGDTGIADYSPLAALDRLQSLSLVSAGVTDLRLATLPALPALRTLTLNDNELTDLSPLVRQTSLASLQVNDNHNLVTLTPLAALPSLASLDLRSTATTAAATSLGALKAMRGLRSVLPRPGDVGASTALTPLTAPSTVRGK